MPNQVGKIYKFRTIVKKKFFSLKGQTLIFSDGVNKDLKHSGKLWSCTTCSGKDGLLTGYSKREDFVSKHKGCTLFMRDTLSKPEKKGWGKSLDKKTLPGPFGRPKDHVWTGRQAGTKEANKATPKIQQER